MRTAPQRPRCHRRHARDNQLTGKTLEQILMLAQRRFAADQLEQELPPLAVLGIEGVLQEPLVRELAMHEQRSLAADGQLAV